MAEEESRLGLLGSISSLFGTPFVTTADTARYEADTPDSATPARKIDFEAGASGRKLSSQEGSEATENPRGSDSAQEAQRAGEAENHSKRRKPRKSLVDDLSSWVDPELRRDQGMRTRASSSRSRRVVSRRKLESAGKRSASSQQRPASARRPSVAASSRKRRASATPSRRKAQARTDDQLREELEDLTVKELQRELRARGLPCSGLKAALQQRLRELLFPEDNEGGGKEEEEEGGGGGGKGEEQGEEEDDDAEDEEEGENGEGDAGDEEPMEVVDHEEKEAEGKGEGADGELTEAAGSVAFESQSTSRKRKAPSSPISRQPKLVNPVDQKENMKAKANHDVQVSEEALMTAFDLATAQVGSGRQGMPEAAVSDGELTTTAATAAGSGVAEAKDENAPDQVGKYLSSLLLGERKINVEELHVLRELIEKNLTPQAREVYSKKDSEAEKLKKKLEEQHSEVVKRLEERYEAVKKLEEQYESKLKAREEEMEEIKQRNLRDLEAALEKAKTAVPQPPQVQEQTQWRPETQRPTAKRARDEEESSAATMLVSYGELYPTMATKIGSSDANGTADKAAAALKSPQKIFGIRHRSVVDKYSGFHPYNPDFERAAEGAAPVQPGRGSNGSSMVGSNFNRLAMQNGGQGNGVTKPSSVLVNRQAREDRVVAPVRRRIRSRARSRSFTPGRHAKAPVDEAVARDVALRILNSIRDEPKPVKLLEAKMDRLSAEDSASATAPLHAPKRQKMLSSSASHLNGGLPGDPTSMGMTGRLSLPDQESSKPDVELLTPIRPGIYEPLTQPSTKANSSSPGDFAFREPDNTPQTSVNIERSATSSLQFMFSPPLDSAKPKGSAGISQPSASGQEASTEGLTSSVKLWKTPVTPFLGAKSHVAEDSGAFVFTEPRPVQTTESQHQSSAFVQRFSFSKPTPTKPRALPSERSPAEHKRATTTAETQDKPPSTRLSFSDSLSQSSAARASTPQGSFPLFQMAKPAEAAMEKPQKPTSFSFVQAKAEKKEEKPAAQFSFGASGSTSTPKATFSLGTEKAQTSSAESAPKESKPAEGTQPTFSFGFAAKGEGSNASATPALPKSTEDSVVRSSDAKDEWVAKEETGEKPAEDIPKKPAGGAFGASFKSSFGTTPSAATTFSLPAPLTDRSDTEKKQDLPRAEPLVALPESSVKTSDDAAGFSFGDSSVQAPKDNPKGAQSSMFFFGATPDGPKTSTSLAPSNRKTPFGGKRSNEDTKEAQADENPKRKRVFQASEHESDAPEETHTKANLGFRFGSASTSITQAMPSTTTVTKPQESNGSQSVASSGFKLGSTTPVAPNKAEPASFTFGAPQPQEKPSEDVPKTAPTLTSTEAASKPSFTFGASTGAFGAGDSKREAPAQAPSQTPSQTPSLFTFGSPNPTAGAQSSTSEGQSMFRFGGGTSASTQPSFGKSFGASKSEGQKDTSQSSSNITTSTAGPTPVSTGFTFGASTLQSSPVPHKGSVSGYSSDASGMDTGGEDNGGSSTPVASNTSGFGSPNPGFGNAAGSATSFQGIAFNNKFGSATNTPQNTSQASQPFGQSTFATGGPQGSGFQGFGASAAPPGGGFSSTPSSFGFGNGSAPASQPNSGFAVDSPFSIGTTTKTPTPNNGGSIFSLGGNSASGSVVRRRVKARRPKRK